MQLELRALLPLLPLRVTTFQRFPLSTSSHLPQDSIDQEILSPLSPSIACKCLPTCLPSFIHFRCPQSSSRTFGSPPEKLQLPKTFHLSQAWIKFSTWQYVKELLYDIAPIDCCHLLLGWVWLRFKTIHLDERSLYSRHEGHQKKQKFMTPRQVSKDQRRLKEKTEKERIQKEVK